MSAKQKPEVFSRDDDRAGGAKNESEIGVLDQKRVESSTIASLWTLLFVLISSRFLFYLIEHLLDELVPARSGFRLAFLAAVTLLATFLYFSCTEHRIKRIESLRREKEMLGLLLCGEGCCD